uniref:Ovule protein n=1 Tax=Strongyloides stercoralis TaxID=6248 RepID=A0A0K0EAI1_STRER
MNMKALLGEIGGCCSIEVFRHYYCCFGSCCLIGAESDTLRLFGSKMEAVVQLELNLDQRELYWEKLKAVALLGSDNEEKELFWSKSAAVV